MKYSIITVNYNNKDGLKKTIESVIHQSYRDFEYIIIDGGSTDGSAELLKEYSDKITYWVSEPDKGIYNGMNKGIAKATGDYLNFMNSGDCFYADDVLQHVADYNYNADFIVGRDYHYSERLQQGHAHRACCRLRCARRLDRRVTHPRKQEQPANFAGFPALLTLVSACT